MTSRHHDLEYIPLDSGPGDQNPIPRPLASARYAGYLFLAAVFFAGILIGGGVGRWVTVPNVITTLIPSTATPNPVHYEPVVTIFDSFADLYAPCPIR